MAALLTTCRVDDLPLCQVAAGDCQCDLMDRLDDLPRGVKWPANRRLVRPLGGRGHEGKVTTPRSKGEDTEGPHCH